MRRSCNHIIIALCAAAAPCLAIGADDDLADDIKELDGISIRGDQEAPKSLYIVPWHNAELKQSTSLSNNLHVNDMRAVDRNSFRQQLRLHELGRSGWYRLTPDRPSR